jgi:hypothetical protein
MAKKNSYEKKAHRKQMLNGTGAHAGDAKSKGMLILTNVIAAVAGAGVGAAVGRSSLLIGLVVTGAGSWFENMPATSLGIGMMAGGSYKAASTNGLSGIDGVKERLTAFKEDLKHRLFLDKVIKSKKPVEQSDESTNGMGEVQYFNYPNKELEGPALNFDALDNIEKQIAMSAEKHKNKQRLSGTDDEIEKVEHIL